MIGLWKPVAKFSFKDKFINYTCDIRVRKYAKNIMVCHSKKCLDAGYKYEYVVGTLICLNCGERLEQERKFIYCAYVPSRHEYLDVLNILRRFTFGRWRGIQFCRDFSYPVSGVKPIFYGYSLEEIKRGLTVIDLNDSGIGRNLPLRTTKAFGFRRNKAHATIEFTDLTEEEISKSYELSQNNKLLREL